MTQSLKDRLALVTGASAGIGAATARALDALGCRLILCARRRERLEALAAECRDARVVPLDVRDAGAVAEALSAEPVDILVNNAGLGLGMEPLHAGDPDEWTTMIDTNVKGVLHVYRAVAPGMLERGRGDVVTIGSVAGFQVYSNGNVYCATKHAVRALCEAMRIDSVGSGVRFTAIEPGACETEFSEVRFRGDAERAKRVYDGIDPIRPEDVADAITWAVTRPANINIGSIVIWAAAQASTSVIYRRS